MRDLIAALAVSSGLALLSACAATPVDAPAFGTDPIGRAAQALVAGAQAEDANHADALRVAAGVLEGLGAHPADGEADLASTWASRAEALGAEPVPPRGRTAGPAYRDGLLSSGGSAAFTDIFHSGRAAIVSLAPRGDGAFVLRVRDEAGTEICRQVAESGPAECRWTPVWTAPVRIEVANLSGAPARYFLLTN
ncbi:MAG: hypothetical protein NXI12_10155 [Alphaproteobacteria bacterium]|nr:hypothetical protein [Alphaproteobacteria bacterium]